MADSIESNAAICKKQMYKYIAPTPPNPLIDSSTFSIDFKTRKFLQVGLDSEKDFEVMIHIITSSRHVVISRDILNQMFSLMGTIFSYILDRPVLYKRKVFLETEESILSSMVYCGKKVLVIQSNFDNKQRVLLELDDLMILQSMEYSISETIVRKTELIRPMVLYQVDQILSYLKKFYNIHKGAVSTENLITFVKNIVDDKIIDNVTKNEYCLISQIKSLAVDQLVQKWISIMIEPIESYDVCGHRNWYEYPTIMEEESPAQVDNKPLLNIVYETPSCYSPVSPLSYPEQSENDGPSFYDLMHVPSPLVSPTFFPPKRVEKAKYVYPGQLKRVKRKSLFENMLFDE